MSTPETQTMAQPHLKKQNPDIDPSTLTPLTPEVISRQATINIGTIGHVAHGKSTVVRAISTVQTVRFKNELERNITIKLDRLTDTEIADITKTPDSLLQYVEHLNETFPDSPYLRRQLRRNTKSYGAHIPKTIENDFFPPLRRSKRQRDSVCTDDDTSSVSSHASSRRSYNSTDVPQAKRPKPNKANEYVVEKVLSVEIKDSFPVFYVKWFGWEQRFNTWEGLENLRDTAQLEEFLEHEVIVMGRDHIELFTRELLQDLKMPSSRTDMVEILSEMEDLDEAELKANLILLVRIKLYDKERYPKRLLERTRKMARWKKYHDLRQNQIEKINAWCADVNEKEALSKISVENFNDFDVPPENFVYITKNFPGDGVQINEIPAISCDCPDGCSYRSNCCARQKNLPFAYYSTRSLRLQRGFPIYECNSGCKCGPDCINRVVQQGRKLKLVLFKTADRGWGVRTAVAIPEGQYICEYTGELITSDEAERRGKEYDAAGRTYLFDLDFSSPDNLYTIDALNYGNISRFINHSCEPNCDIYACWGENGDPFMHRIVYFSNRRIEAGEEINIDYLNGNCQAQTTDATIINHDEKVENTDPNSPQKTTPRKTPKKGFRITSPSKSIPVITKNLFDDFSTVTSVPEENVKEEEPEMVKFKCLCGAKKCRNWIFN